MHIPTSLMITPPPSFCPAKRSVLVLLGVFGQMAITAEENQREIARERRSESERKEGESGREGEVLRERIPVAIHTASDLSHFDSSSEC